MIRLAVIDAGDQVDNYLAALARLDNVHVTAIVDANQAAARRLSSHTAVTTTHSLGEFWEAQGQHVDAVVVHSPVERRGDAVRAAAQHGKHVLVDTPLAGSAEEARRAIESCQQAGVELMVAQPMRYMPYQQTVQESLAAGKLGAPGLLRIHHWHPEVLDNSQARRSRLELVIQEIDVACWLFGAAPEMVYANTLHEQAPELGMQIHFGFPNGAMALIDCTRTQPSGADSYYMLTLIGSTGAAYADDHRNTNLLFRGDTSGLRVGQGQDHFGRQLQEFAKAIQQGHCATCTGEDGQRAIVVAEAAIESCTSNRAAKRVGDRYEFQ